MPWRKSPSFKPRELRRPVVLPALVREGAGWSDGCILNLSSRGLLLHAKSSAGKDGVVELRHRQHVIVARVVWRQGAQVGLRTDERLPIEDIAPPGQARAPQPGEADERTKDRRRPTCDEDQSRNSGRKIEFIFAVVFGAALAAAASAMVGSALVAPLARAQAALGR